MLLNHGISVEQAREQNDVGELQKKTFPPRKNVIFGIFPKGFSSA